MGRSCPSLQTWIHMSVLQEANVLLLCQSTSSAGAEGGRRTDGRQKDQYVLEDVTTVLKLNNSTSQHSVFCTWMEGKLLFGFSCMSVPNDCCLPGDTNMQLELIVNITDHQLHAHESSYVSCWLVYLVYSCTEDKIAFFIPLEGKDGTFVLAQCAGQVSCGAQTWAQSVSITSTQSISDPDTLVYANLPLDGSAVQGFKGIKRLNSTASLFGFSMIQYTNSCIRYTLMFFSLHMLQVNFMLLSNEIKSSHHPSSIFWQSRRRSRLLTACPRSARERERERGVRVCQTGDDRPVWTPFCLMQSRLDELFCSDSAAISREVVCVCVSVCVFHQRGLVPGKFCLCPWLRFEIHWLNWRKISLTDSPPAWDIADSYVPLLRCLL